MLPGGEDDGGKHLRRGAGDAEAEDASASSAASLNDLCATAAAAAAGAPAPLPRAAAWALAALLAAGLGVGALVLAVVHSAALLAVSLVLSAAVAVFLLWNAAAAASGRALRRFVDGLPASSLRVAADGQLVKITGSVSCSDISLISSYEKVENCVYTSTLLRKCGRWGFEILNPMNRCYKWKLTHAEPLAEMQGKAAYKRPKWSDPSPDPAQAGATCTGLPLFNVFVIVINKYSLVRILGFIDADDVLLIQTFCGVEQRFAADFHITDAKSGKIALVKAGHHSKVVPLVDENILVTTSRDTELSSTLKYWLEERNLSSEEAQLIRLEEGYIREGMRLSVIGILSKKNGDAMILPPQEPVSTGCVLLSFLLPTYFDGIVLRLVDRSYFVPNSGVS